MVTKKKKKKLKSRKGIGGRPTVMTNDVLLKLEQAFALGCTDLEACYYAGITKTPLYNYQKENQEFRERKELLKSKPILMARQSVMDGIVGNTGKGIKQDPDLALKFLERKKKDEFGLRHEFTGAGGEPLGDLTEKDRLDIARAYLKSKGVKKV